MQVVRRYEENAEEVVDERLLKMPRNMPRNWVWNFNPKPFAETDEVNRALIGRCAKEKLKKK